jgi:flagellar hook-associated protein FlgK
MSLSSALSIATGGLANINAEFALISQNVANAATPGYAAEVGTQQSLTADGVGLGVRTGPARLQIDQALLTSVTQQNAMSATATLPRRPFRQSTACLEHLAPAVTSAAFWASCRTASPP